MLQAPDLPVGAAILVAMLVLMGAAITFVGSVGLLRLGQFQQRMHAPTLGSTLGTGCILLASIIGFSVLESRVVIHEILLGLLLTLTTPVGFMLLARAAIYRTRMEMGITPSSKSISRSTEHSSQ